MQSGPWGASAPGRAPLQLSAHLRRRQALSPAARLALWCLLLNLEVSEEGRHKLTALCCARRLLFCLVVSQFPDRTLVTIFCSRVLHIAAKAERVNFRPASDSGKSPVYFSG